MTNNILKFYEESYDFVDCLKKSRGPTGVLQPHFENLWDPAYRFLQHQRFEDSNRVPGSLSKPWSVTGKALFKNPW